MYRIKVLGIAEMISTRRQNKIQAIHQAIAKKDVLHGATNANKKLLLEDTPFTYPGGIRAHDP
jgi:hypothetical protein